MTQREVKLSRCLEICINGKIKNWIFVIIGNVGELDTPLNRRHVNGHAYSLLDSLPTT